MKLTATPIYRNEYWIAFLSAFLLTILVCWLTILWLFPQEKNEWPGRRQHLQEATNQMGR